MPTTYTITRANDASYDFTIGLDAAFATATTIRWEIHPTEGKFPLALTAPVTGTVAFSTTDTSQSASPQITRNHKFPRDFEIRLYNAADNTLRHTSDAQNIAGDSTLAGVESLDGGGGDDKNIIGLGASEALVANGLRKNDAYIVTRYQYGNVEISDTFGDANLIKFDYGVTITAVSESASIVFGNISYGSITLTLSTGAEVEITSPAGRFSYQLGDGAVLNYLDFKAAIKVAHDSSDSSIPPVASLPNEYAITTLTSVPELSANRVEADVSLDDAGGGDREDIISAASDYILDLNGLRSNDIYVITRFQHGNVEISDTFGDANLIKFDSAVTITAVSESASVVFGNISYGSITLTLSTGAEVEITSPAGRFSYQIGDGEVMNYIDFKAAIKVAHDSTNPAIPPVASLPQEFTVSSSRFDITGDALDGDVDEDVGDADALFTFKAVLKSDANADVGYSITGGNTGGVFEVVKLNDGSGNAVISLAPNKNLDYEDPSIPNSYTLTVQLSAMAAGATEAETQNVPVTISVNNLDEGEATYIVVGNVDAGVELEARRVAEDPDGTDASVTAMYRWFRKASSDPDPASFETLQTTTFKWLGAASTDNTYTIGTLVDDADYGVLVRYQDNRVGADLSFTSALALTVEFGASIYSGSIDEDGKNITTIDIDATLDDPDITDNITYAFVTDDAGTTAATHLGFAIDSDGVITFTGSTTHIDYDTDPRTERIDLTVRATHDNGDTNIPNPFSNVEVAISVNDLNDEKPVLDGAEDGVSINEMTATGGDFATGYTFTLTDADAVDDDASFTADDFGFSDSRFGVKKTATAGTWELVLKNGKTLNYETTADQRIDLEITVEDANDNESDPLPITITVQNRNDAGTLEITRNPIVKTLTATLTDQDGILTAADGGGASDPSYEWFDVATSEIVSASEIVSTDATYTYTDDSAHYSVRVNYQDNFGTYTLTASIAPLPFYFYNDEGNIAENDASKSNAALILVARNDGSIIAAADIEAAVFVTEDGTTATTHKGFTISTKNLAFGSIGLGTASNWGLNYEALTPDEKKNGISLVIRTTHDGTTIDFNFNAKIADRPESVIFDDGVGEVDYTDYLKTITLPDGAYSTTDMVHNAVATATSGGAITYSLIGTDAGLFDIDPTSGVVTFKADTTLDASTKDTYQFEVLATETGTSNTERQSVTITVVGENGIALALSASGSAIITENAAERDTGISFTITDDGTNNVFNSGSFTISAGAGTIDATADKFIIVQNGNAWDLRLKTDDGSGNLARLDYETDGTTGTINLNVKVNDGVVDSNPVPITITLTNLNEAGVVVIERDTLTKTLTATLTDDDGIGAAADGGGAIDPTYEWYDVATGEIVRTASTTNTFTYTDDNAHYRVRVEYTDGFSDANVAVEGSTAPISLSPISVQLGEHTTASVPLTAKRTSDGSTIASDALTLAFVLEDGSIANTYKGITISDTGIMPESAEKLNYEALTDDEKTNGIDFTIRATSGTDSVDSAFKVRIADTAESVSFGTDYTDYIPMLNVLDGTSYSTTDVVHTAAATATGAITYTLGGADAGLFDIGTNGDVVFKSATTLAASTKSTYEFTVTATDATTSDTEHQSVTLNAKSIIFTTPLDEEFTQFEINIDNLISGAFSTSGHKIVNAATLDYETTGTSEKPTAAITGGADRGVFEVDLLTQTPTTGEVQITLQRNGLVKKHQYEVEITITHPTTEETEVRTVTLVVIDHRTKVPIPEPAPAGTPPPITPDRTEEAHDPIDPDTDPLAGLTPIPDTDPHAG